MTAALIIAIYGAVLSSIVLVWNIAWAIRSSRSRLRIELIPSYGIDRGTAVDGFLVSISNPSAVRITLFEALVWRELDRHPPIRHWWNRHVRRKQTPEGWQGELLRTDNYKSPTSLGPGEAIEFIAPLEAVQAASKGTMPVRISVRDGLMRHHFTEARSR